MWRDCFQRCNITESELRNGAISLKNTNRTEVIAKWHAKMVFLWVGKLGWERQDPDFSVGRPPGILVITNLRDFAIWEQSEGRNWVITYWNEGMIWLLHSCCKWKIKWNKGPLKIYWIPRPGLRRKLSEKCLRPPFF